jgi:hypothetical protein
MVTMPLGVVFTSNLYPSSNPIPINTPELAAFTSTNFLEPSQIAVAA